VGRRPLTRGPLAPSAGGAGRGGGAERRAGG
jgi:hypothetical protein